MTVPYTTPTTAAQGMAALRYLDSLAGVARPLDHAWRILPDPERRWVLQLHAALTASRKVAHAG
jgi:hypothetical protein